MTLLKPAVTRITDEQSVVVERREALLHTVLGSVTNPKKGDARQQHGQLLKGCTRPTLRGVVPARVEIPADAGQQLITQSRRRFRSLGKIGGQASPPASKVARPGLCFWIKSFRQGLQEALSKSPLQVEGKKQDHRRAMLSIARMPLAISSSSRRPRDINSLSGGRTSPSSTRPGWTGCRSRAA